MYTTNGGSIIKSNMDGLDAKVLVRLVGESVALRTDIYLYGMSTLTQEELGSFLDHLAWKSGMHRFLRAMRNETLRDEGMDYENASIIILENERTTLPFLESVGAMRPI